MGSNKPATRNQRAKLAADLNDLFKDLQSSQVKVVGNYHLGQVIGQGTYGKVKLANHVLTGQQVAIKVVAKSHVSIITREIYHWRCLTHPNIAHLHEVLTTESKIYLVTEYCANGELLEALIRDGRCKPSLAKRWFRQICLALQYCHSRKIVHRDLKLENILLDSQNNIKLIDFGFTRECESKKLLESYCGSAAYTAPEIIVGKKYSGPEADIWSLGVILYTLLAGYLPFDDDNEAVVQDKIVDLDYEIPTDIIGKDAQDLIQGILKENPKERFSIEQILNHQWWTPQSDDDEPEPDSGHNGEERNSIEGKSQHGRQGSLTKREIHPVHSSQRPNDVFYGSPQIASPMAQHAYGAWGSQSPHILSSQGDFIKAFPGVPAVPSPLSSPLPSPSPMVNKSFPRYDPSADASQIGRSPSAGGFPASPFEQRLLAALGKVGFDQEIFSKGVPSQSCDPGYGLWCLLVEQVRQRSIDNGTALEWEQSVAFMDSNTIGMHALAGYPNNTYALMENGKRSPRPMSDPSPSSSQTNLLQPLASLYQQQQQQENIDLQQQNAELKLQVDQYKLEAELLKLEKTQLEKEKQRHEKPKARDVHPFESKDLPPINDKIELSEEPQVVSKSERHVQDSGVSVSTSSTPHSSWELPEREGPVISFERPRRKSKGILNSIKDRLFFSTASDAEGSHSGAPSPYPPSPVPPKVPAGATASASSSTSSAITYATSAIPKPLPAPPPHPYTQQLLQQYTTPSPLSAVSFKSASTSSLAMENGHATRLPLSNPKLAVSSDNLVLSDHSIDPETTFTTPKNKGFMSWITESASGTVLNKSPVAQNPAKVPKRVNTRSLSATDSISNSMDTLVHPEEARPQIPAIPASFFQPIWKSPVSQGSSSSLSSTGAASTSSLATSAPTMTFRQRLTSFSSSTAKITPEERQRATAAAAAAAALIAQPALPERAHSPSPPSSPRGSGGSGVYSTILSAHSKGSAKNQDEISEIVAAAVAATANANLKSSVGSRKKNVLQGAGSKKSKSHEKSKSSVTSSGNHQTHQLTGPYSTVNGYSPQTAEISKKHSSTSLLIPSPTITASQTKDTSNDTPRKPSIKSSKASMPSLMTAFSSFKPTKSQPSSPLVQQAPRLPTHATSPTQSNSSYNQVQPVTETKAHHKREDLVTSPRSTRSSTAMSSIPTRSKPLDDTRSPSADGNKLKDHTRAFDDGVVVTEEVRPKKRTTSRTSITAASIGRRSSESVTSSHDRSEPSSPHAAVAGATASQNKRTSLGSMSSRRSSTSSTRDRNIFGLTLDGTGTGSRKSSLNLSRTSLSKSSFQSPAASPAPRRGGEMDRSNYGYTSRASQDEVHPISSASDDMLKEHGPQSVPNTMPTHEKPQTISRVNQGQHSRSGSSQETRESIRREKSPMDAPSPTFQPRGSGSVPSNSTNSAKSGTSLANSVAASPSISASSSLTRVTISENEEAYESPQKGANSTNPQDEDSIFNYDAPRLDFADGCSLIPSPPPSPSPPPFSPTQTLALAIPTSPNQSLLEQPKSNLLSTSYPPPRTSFSYTQGMDSDNIDALQESTSPPSPSRPLVTFDQHFSNQAKIKEHRDSTPRKVVTGFQPLAAKRLSKPGLPNNASSTNVEDAPPVPGQSSSQDSTVSGRPPSSSFSTAGPPNAFAGRRRGYRNSTGSMANMTLQQQQNFQQLQKEQLLRIQQNQPNAGYEATAAMKINPRPRTGLYPKREYGGAALGGLGGHNNSAPSPMSQDYDRTNSASKRESYSRRQSMAVAMGKRPGAAPAAIQEEEE
ncbi:hypothetical protein BGZ76_009075 [Entomortierella beljakovae]|nr:hypothetical protein BGZ76_009075 [Entomortierella beljakovae]